MRCVGDRSVPDGHRLHRHGAPTLRGPRVRTAAIEDEQLTKGPGRLPAVGLLQVTSAGRLSVVGLLQVTSAGRLL